MAHDPDTIFKALRPVPEFDGNPNVLIRFIRICDQIVVNYLSTEPGSELPNQCLLNGILNKITGPAATIINSNGIPDNWLGIRDSLINNFADQRDETALYNDLSLATQGQRTPQEFYDYCQNLLSTVMTYVNLHDSLETTVQAKRSLYRKLALQAFVRGLEEPLSSRIRCMRPDNLEKALEYVQEELNVMYLKQRNEPPKVQQTPKVTPVGPMMSPRPLPLQAPAPNWPVQQRSIPMQPQPFKFTHQQPQQGFRVNPSQNQPQFRMPTRTQQMFSSRPPNYNPQSNVFRLQPRNQPQYFPKPMSGVQHYATRQLPPTGLGGHDWRRNGNPPPSNYFKQREVNMNDCRYYDDTPYYPEFNHESDYAYYPDMYETYDQTDDTTDPYEQDNNSSDQQLQLTYPGCSEPEDQPQPSTSKDQNFLKGLESKKLR